MAHLDEILTVMLVISLSVDLCGLYHWPNKRRWSMSHVSECDITTFGRLAAIARVRCNNTVAEGVSVLNTETETQTPVWWKTKLLRIGRWIYGLSPEQEGHSVKHHQSKHWLVFHVFKLSVFCSIWRCIWVGIVYILEFIFCCHKYLFTTNMIIIADIFLLWQCKLCLHAMKSH